METDETYGEVLGQYFEVAAAISRLSDEAGNPEASSAERYERLRKRRRALRGRLERFEEEQDPTDIESILDQALPAE